MNYMDIYFKRLNRFGNDYQSRIQGEREADFEKYLLKTIYRVDFMYDGQHYAGSLERNTQNETKTLQYLLTNVHLDMPSGTILFLVDKNNVEQPWMVYYLENIKASGYNRYIMLKMTHFLSWTARDGSTQTSWAYLYGQEDNMLKEELRSRSRMETVYNEDLKSNFFILPRTQYIKKDDYLLVGDIPFQESYRVTGYDIQSTPGVEYVTIDPTYKYDTSAAPSQTVIDSDENFFWLNGGNP